jgi:archaellum biogenesis protein FlaJ (TadC family)
LIYEREQKDRHAEIQGFWKVLATKIDAGADVISWTRAEIDTAMKIRNPEKNFERVVEDLPQQVSIFRSEECRLEKTV